ncbi:MAG: hypothetical protein M1820_002869 [Bogoriella megaspora]|nr:MAG: hypothetical protein M1820_002869 [Bogoriella megaspora]
MLHAAQASGFTEQFIKASPSKSKLQERRMTSHGSHNSLNSSTNEEYGCPFYKTVASAHTHPIRPTRRFPELILTLSTPPLSLNGRHQIDVTLIYPSGPSINAKPITFKEPILDWRLDGLPFALFHKTPHDPRFIKDESDLR